MNKSFYTIIIMLSITLFIASCSDDDDSGNEIDVIELPANLSFESLSLYPEDFAYDAENGRFFTGSIFTGNIISVDWSGNVSTLVDSDELISTIGILFDEANNEVIVLNSNPGFSDQGVTQTTGSLAMVLRYNASTGEEVARYDLASLNPNSGHLVNDLVMDDNGNIYVTDSFSPAIYRITPGGQMSIFADNSLFETPAGTFGLNGIAFNSDGFLLVAHNQNQQLLRVSISDPTNVTVVEMDRPIGAGDGIRMNNDDLYYVNNSLAGEEQWIHQINSTDGFATASVTTSVSLGSDTNFPTTVEIVNDLPYVIDSYLIWLLANPAMTDRANFEISRIDF